MECLESLANTNCFSILQEKLNTWLFEFKLNCPEANIGRCCDLLELNAKIQAQLFKLLGVCALQEGLSGNEMKLAQLESILGKDYLVNGITKDAVIDILQSIPRKNGIVPHIPNSPNKRSFRVKPKKSKHPSSMKAHSLENSPHKHYSSNTSISNSEVKLRLNELEDAIIELSNEHQPVRNNKQMDPTNKKKKRRKSLTRSSSLPDNYDLQSNVELRDEEDEHHGGDFSGSDVAEIRSDIYLQNLVARYNDLFSQSRIEAMNLLRQYNDDQENNQRIIFALIMTSARQVVELQKTVRNPYGIRNTQLSQNLQFRETISRSNLKNLRARIIYEMIHKKGRYFHFHLPQGGFNFGHMQMFLDTAIEMFWNFGGTVNGLNLLEAADGELFNEHKYRRSYDSDYHGSLVNHHIWPCLLQGDRVLVKGEACTKSCSIIKDKRCINSSRSRK